MSTQRSRRQLAFSGASSSDVCAVCLGQHSRTSLPKYWKDQHARDFILSMDLSTDSPVCRSCRDDVARVLANPAYTPRWERRGGESMKSNCCIHNCNQLCFSQTTMGTIDELQGIQELVFNDPVPIPTPLCKSHYHLVYDTLQSRRKHCRTCSRRLRLGNDRPCLQPHIIQAHLSQHTDFDGDILSSDRVCITCYKSHMVLLMQNKPISLDDDLKLLVDSISQQPSGTDHDIICAATNRMLITVGKMLIENRAALLASIHFDFTQHAKDLFTAKGIEEPPELKVTSRLILGEITATFQHHVAYACKVQKYGILVYRPTSDLVALLCETKWKLKQVNANVKPVMSEVLDTDACKHNSTDLKDTCTIGHFNKLIHDQIDLYLGPCDKASMDYDDLNLDKQIKKINPQLWNAICCITRSKSEIRGTSKVSDPHSSVYHVKKIRRFFLLCSMLFATDDRCSMPMHTLMTDVVESQGGSSVLVKVLNRLGVCSSADTLACFIQHKRSTSDQHQFKHISKDAFTVVSADNLDFMHSFARVFCSNQKSSWHGTTVQVTQPLPSHSLPERPTTQLQVPCSDTHVSLTGTSHGGHGDTHVSLTDTPHGGHRDTRLPHRHLSWWSQRHTCLPHRHLSW